MSPSIRVLVALGLLAGSVAAQEPPTAPLVLRLPGGTRAMGLGNGFTAGSGAEVLFYNPAQIGRTRGTAISLQRIGSEATLGTLSTVGPLGKVSIGAGVEYLHYNSQSVLVFTRPAELPAGGILESSSLAATVAAAVRFKGIRFGAAGKYVQEQVLSRQDGGMALDIGAARELGRVTVALAVQNIGGSISMFDQTTHLPTRVSAGAISPDIRLGTYFDVVIAGAVSRERDGRIVPGGGVELSYEPVDGWSFVARAGARRVDEGPGPQESPVTLGGSFGLDRFWLDYAFQPSRGGLGAFHKVGIRIQ